ncbi:hypothetical protein [Agaribacterium sp. ZY112]|uniref:hypothetical protein n=1 Tax=Agaribacterium sp. ZY112 TaxID=3233574 RepID=UPI0035266E4F
MTISLSSILILVLNAGVLAGTESSVKGPLSHKDYERYLANLRQSDEVLPQAPNSHPVAAMYNREAVIPPQCYTKTEGKNNPCYVCHQNEIKGRENVMNDGALQIAYSFSDEGLSNHWKNLFEDKRSQVEQISDEEIHQWIDTDNYSALAARLKEVGFKGWIPDLHNLHLGAEAFDKFGFAKDGSHWVAFNYKPMPSTFWPTNGSTDDVMIRLPEVYRQTVDGEYSLDVYRANLSILEANIKGLKSISSLPINEKNIGKDLNQDGEIGEITSIDDISHYVGAAEPYFIDTHLYPEGTEFLHTVRYVGIDENQQITVSKRMKEVRYMKKWRAYQKGVYARQYELESYEKAAGHLPGYQNLGDYGLDNGNGWSIQGFIESHNGELRANTYEENFFCMGCHTSIGSTIDKTFSFARKVDGGIGWSYIDLKKMHDAPNMGEKDGEILTYFQRAGGGDELRSNSEMLERWFNADGSVNKDKVRAAPNLYSLIVPSVERALELNKAYKVIVENQDFIYGRDATVTSPKNVYQTIDNKNSPTLPIESFYSWDIRLDWQAGANRKVVKEKNP